MSENELVLKSINQLLEYRFFIPSYQRGYRWTVTEVNSLLDDIAEFNPEQIKDTDKSTWYCLQPLVLRKCDDDIINKYGLSDDWYEVIDGQQRLTTIYLILHYLNQGKIESRRKKLFELHYATRSNLQSYLEKELNNNIIDDSNIDIFHITQAYDTINKWFQIKGSSFDEDNFSSKFSFSTNVIWYEVNDGSDSSDIFTRLNIGKIQLTNAELIKALFLKRWNVKEDVDKLRLKQLQIASEWDRIENTLQNDKFWYFIYNDKESKPKYTNRIEYIFDLMGKKPEGAEDKFTFYKFYEEFQKSKNESKYKIPDTDLIWLETKKYFQTFQEWYADNELYHLIGFLIITEINIQGLLDVRKNKSKTLFKEHLINEIRKKVNCDIEILEYGNTKIKLILLLFNIQTIVANNKSNMRFPFDLYKKGDWDIEHIRSKTDKVLIGEDRRDWAKDILEYFTGIDETVKQEEYINNLAKDEENKIFGISSGGKETKAILLELFEIVNSNKIDEVKFNKLYKDVCELFRENNEPSKCAISNLALLNSNINRSYQNAFFPIKRKIILENDKIGTFVPICTKNVFMKAYSKQFYEIMYWNKFDAEYYLMEIEKTLIQYLPEKEMKNGN